MNYLFLFETKRLCLEEIRYGKHRSVALDVRSIPIVSRWAAPGGDGDHIIPYIVLIQDTIWVTQRGVGKSFLTPDNERLYDKLSLWMSVGGRTLSSLFLT